MVGKMSIGENMLMNLETKSLSNLCITLKQLCFLLFGKFIFQQIYLMIHPMIYNKIILVTNC